MKKLILLAVVILGFAATSFAQSANASVNGVINTPTVAALSVNWVQNMDFGTITNNATTSTQGSPTGDAYMRIIPQEGNGLVTVTQNKLTSTVAKPAKFRVNNVYTTGTPGGLASTDITLTNYTDHTLSNGNAWFDTNSGGTTNTDCGNYVCTNSYLVPGSTTDYYVVVGGILQMNKLATGSINVSGLTVTINGH